MPRGLSPAFQRRVFCRLGFALKGPGETLIFPVDSGDLVVRVGAPLHFGSLDYPRVIYCPFNPKVLLQAIC